MSVLNQFSLPYRGIGNGEHKYTFEIAPEFFEKFENSNFKDSQFAVDLLVDKKSDRCLLTFDIEGKKFTQCDRCNADIMLPIEGHYQLHIKFGQGDGGDTDEIVYLEGDTSILDVSSFVYEFIVLSEPLITTCDNDPSQVCDPEVLKYLSTSDDSAEGQDTSSLWDTLKDLDFKQDNK